MSRSYVCIDWNETAQTCEGAAWVEQPSVMDALPTLAQANSVGSVMFLSLAAIAAMSLLLPSRGLQDE